MLTKKDYCDYETCVALKELGYDEYCESSFITENITVDCVDMLGDLYEADFEKGDLINRAILSNKRTPIPTLPAPNLYEAQKWLRERHNLHITIFSQSQESWQYRITKPHQRLEDGLHDEDFVSYEDALSYGIKRTIEILKEE